MDANSLSQHGQLRVLLMLVLLPFARAIIDDSAFLLLRVSRFMEDSDCAPLLSASCCWADCFVGNDDEGEDEDGEDEFWFGCF